jgi:hypothetical protein
MNESMNRIFSRNESTTDRILRGALGILLALAAFSFSGVVSTVLAVAAAVMMTTAIVGFCPVYRLLGITTSHLPDH